MVERPATHRVLAGAEAGRSDRRAAHERLVAIGCGPEQALVPLEELLRRLTPQQAEGLEAAVRHLRDGPAGREAALEALADAGFSWPRAEVIVAAIVAELERRP